MFLYGHPRIPFRIVGWTQGTFRIRRNSRTGLETFASTLGTFTGVGPTAQQPDAPLGDDDRAGMRTLYSDPNDIKYIGSIEGRVLPANPLSLPASPPNVTGIFGARVVAVDVASGTVMAGALGGWSCQAPGPVHSMEPTSSIMQPAVQVIPRRL